MVPSKNNSSHNDTSDGIDPKRTPIFIHHQALNAKIVDFGGWALPVNYGSQIEEHLSVRSKCGLFDVSHMTVSDILGLQTLPFLEKLLANDINKASHLPGKALYSCMLNDDGGVIDDLIVYYINDQHCRLVSNASTNERVIAWIKLQIGSYQAELIERTELALLAIQGPTALSICQQVLDKEFADIALSLNRFQGAFWGQEFVGRTGYTGEDGLELIISATLAQRLWTAFIDAGVQACGLGARDTLRLESGMALYGNDLDIKHTPLESGLKWTVSLNDDRDFIGKSALLSAPKHKAIGLILEDKGVIRQHQEVWLNDEIIGEITSGTFSPSLSQSIGMARVTTDAKLIVGDKVKIAVRNKHLSAVVARTPFIKNGTNTN